MQFAGMRRFISLCVGWFVSLLFWLWTTVPKALDWVGRSTLPDDWRQLMDERLPAWAAWLFSTPWWVPALLAAALTFWLMWLSWPRQPKQDDAVTRHVFEAASAPATDIEPTKADPLDATYGDAHERLELFILDYILPACGAQIVLQTTILKEMCSGDIIPHFVEQGVKHDYMHWTFCQQYERLSRLVGSPKDTMSIRQMIECVCDLENGSYKRFVDQASELDKALDANNDHRNAIRGLWRDWGERHNRLVEAFDALKRESRYGPPLYRPQRPSRWGGLVTRGGL